MSDTGCDVCLYGADDIDNDFYSDSVLTARKPHVCCECEREISRGIRYQRAVGKSDGQMWTYKTCLLCVEVRRVFYCGGGYFFGMLWDDMQEQAFPQLTTASACFRELSPEAKAVVLDRWMRWKGLAPREVTA